MKRKSISLILVIAVFLILSIVLISCAGKGKDRIFSDEVTLKILYDPEAYSAILNFQAANPEIELELIRLDQELDTGIEKHEPDLIIITPNHAHREQWEKGKNAADLREFCANDTSIDINNYFPETFEIFTNADNELYALPLGITFNMLTIREENWAGSEFEVLGENYTGKEVLKAIKKELDQEREIDEFFDCSPGCNLTSWLYILNGIEKSEEGFWIDEELFELIYNVSMKWSEQYWSAKERWGNRGLDGDTNCESMLNPTIYEGKYEVSFGRTLNSAPQLCLFLQLIQTCGIWTSN